MASYSDRVKSPILDEELNRLISWHCETGQPAYSNGNDDPSQIAVSNEESLEKKHFEKNYQKHDLEQD